MRVMKNMFSVCGRILDEKSAGLRAKTFESLCVEEGADLVGQDNQMYAHFGMSGDDILGVLGRYRRKIRYK